MIIDPLEYLYKTAETSTVFGDKWCGPSQLTQWDEILCAVYQADPGDGHKVEVYISAAPAQFFALKVFAHDGRHDYTINTGAGFGIDKLVADMAMRISCGMITFESIKSQK